MKANTNIIFYSILAFHIVWCLTSFYSMFAEFDSWTIYHFKPFCMLLLTLAWVGVCAKNYIFGLVYIGLVMIEFLTKAVMRGSIEAEVFGKVMFPVDLIFVSILLLLFKNHFGILQRPNPISDKFRKNS